MTSEKLAAQIKELNFSLYKGTYAEDFLILRWWVKISESGDLVKMLPRASQPLFAFGKLFHYPTKLFYSLYEGEIWFAVWMSMMGYAVIFNMWCDKRFRGTRKQAQYTRVAYDAAFEVSNVVLGFTKRYELLRVHQHIGYKVLGRIPKMFDGIDDVWMVMLTKENYLNGEFRKNDKLFKKGDVI